MEILNVRVNGLEESIIASNYPMMDSPYTKEQFEGQLEGLKSVLSFGKKEDILNNKHIKRAIKLGKAKSGSGHDCFQKGIKVSFDMKAPEWFWRQHDRYHFSDYVSSMSKMHRITRVDLNECCNEYVTERILEDLKTHIKIYNKFEEYKNACDGLELRNGKKVDFTKENLFKIIINNVPAGFELTARVETNYLQEKSKYFQRKNHKMYAWKDIYCPFLETLPLFKELCGIK